PKASAMLGNSGPLLIEGGRQGQYFTLLTLKNLTIRKSERITLDDRAFLKNERIALLITRIAALSKQAENTTADRLEFIKKRLALAKEELVKLQKSESMPALKEPNIVFDAIPLTKK